MSKTKKVAKNNMILVLAVCVVVCAVVVLFWMLAKEVYTAQTMSVHESKESIVINTVGAPDDLVTTLLAEKEGCVDMYKDARKKNVDYIVSEADGFALVHYGCGLDAFMFYKKENDKWVRLNPSNNFISNVPLCSHVKQYSIPSSFIRSCYDDSASTSEEKLPPLVPNPVR